MQTCLFAKPLLTNGCCILAYLAVVARQRVYMPQYLLVYGGKEINLNVAMSLNTYICLPLIPIKRMHMKCMLFCCNIAHELKAAGGKQNPFM
jgi:hypothetical protein